MVIPLVLALVVDLIFMVFLTARSRLVAMARSFAVPLAASSLVVYGNSRVLQQEKVR